MRSLPRILIVEDEPAIAELIAVNLRHNGFNPFGPWTVKQHKKSWTMCCPTLFC